VTVEDTTRQESVHDWGRAAVVAGAVGAVALLLQTVLFLLDEAEILASWPTFQESGAGREEDLATFYVALFERQHDMAWNIALRDLLGPVAAIALMVLARALVRVRGGGRADPEVWALVLSVGAGLKLLSDLVYLSQLGLWRSTGFIAEPPADVIATGRASEAVTDLSNYFEYTAYLVLAVGLAGLAGLLDKGLRLLARALVVALVVLVVVSLVDWWPGYAIVSLVTGIVLGPVLLAGLGRSLAGTEPRSP
jgi:hypothetical protein